MTDRRHHLDVNRQQKAYYESRFEADGADERAANAVTNAWTRLRRRIQTHDRSIGTVDRILADHRAWLGDLSQSRVLDLGCFAGNDLSLWLADQSAEYRGLDLSESAIKALQEKLRAQVPEADARARAGDFLANELPDASFDVIYAHSVLHHFANVDLVLEEMHRVLKPGGVVVSLDPLSTEPLIRMVRAAYRPFQSDRDWEWPFTFTTFRQIDRWFEIDRIQGYRGFSMLGLPLATLPLMRRPAHAVGRLGLRLERRFSNRRGLALWLCWMVALRLQKSGGEGQ